MSSKSFTNINTHVVETDCRLDVEQTIRTNSEFLPNVRQRSFCFEHPGQISESLSIVWSRRSLSNMCFSYVGVLSNFGISLLEQVRSLCRNLSQSNCCENAANQNRNTPREFVYFYPDRTSQTARRLRFPCAAVQIHRKATDLHEKHTSIVGKTNGKQCCPHPQTNTTLTLSHRRHEASLQEKPCPPHTVRRTATTAATERGLLLDAARRTTILTTHFAPTEP